MSARERLDPDLLALDPEAAAPEPRPGLRASLLASVADESGLAGFGPRFAAFFDLAGARALELLRIAAGSAGAAGGWVTLPPLAGVELLHFAGGARVARHDCGLVRIAPGVRFPEHTHTGDEWSFVVSGTAEEEGSGALWAPGDVVYRPAGSAHAFRVTSREPLVFGVVLEGGIEIREQQP